MDEFRALQKCSPRIAIGKANNPHKINQKDYYDPPAYCQQNIFVCRFQSYRTQCKQCEPRDVTRLSHYAAPKPNLFNRFSSKTEPLEQVFAFHSLWII